MRDGVVEVLVPKLRLKRQGAGGNGGRQAERQEEERWGCVGGEERGGVSDSIGRRDKRARQLGRASSRRQAARSASFKLLLPLRLRSDALAWGA